MSRQDEENPQDESRTAAEGLAAAVAAIVRSIAGDAGRRGSSAPGGDLTAGLAASGSGGSEQDGGGAGSLRVLTNILQDLAPAVNRGGGGLGWLASINPLFGLLKLFGGRSRAEEIELPKYERPPRQIYSGGISEGTGWAPGAIDYGAGWQMRTAEPDRPTFLGHYIFGYTQKDGATHGTRLGNWGYLKTNEANHRAMAWLLWNLWRAALVIPDGDPQKAYLREKLADQLAILEGYWNITDGEYFQPCTTNPFAPYNEGSRWCWGRLVSGFAMRSPLNLSEARGGTSATVNLNPSLVSRGASPWIDNFVALGIFDMCRTEGLGCALARYHAERQTKLAKSPSGVHGRMMVWYHQPVMRTRSTALTQNLSSTGLTMHVADASLCPEPPAWVVTGGENILVFGRDLVNNTLTIGAGARGGRHFNDGGAAGNHAAGAAVHFNEQFDSLADMYATLTVADGNHDAQVLIRGSSDMVGDVYASHQCAAGMWSEDFSRSKRAGEAWEANCHENEAGGAGALYSVQSDPRWHLSAERGIHQVRVNVSEGTATLRYVAPSGGACRVYVGAAAPAGSDDSADPLDSAAGRQHSFTASGLSAGTHHYRISCGDARVAGMLLVQ